MEDDDEEEGEEETVASHGKSEANDCIWLENIIETIGDLGVAKLTKRVEEDACFHDEDVQGLA